MPVRFLTEDQRERYGRFNAVPDETQLGGYFHLDIHARRQKYREGMEDQLSTLGFMTNVAALWTTVYTQRALEQIRAEGKRPSAADIARLSPLGHSHYNMLGRYNFQLPDIVRTGHLRPLRTPGSPW